MKNLQEILHNHSLWLVNPETGCRAYLIRADLSGADLSGADLSGADLSGADLDLCVEEGLIKKIAEIVLADNKKLYMKNWHSCDTIHCIAGWACHLSPNGKDLEGKFGTNIAGLMLLGIEAHDHFYDADEAAIKWLKTKVESNG